MAYNALPFISLDPSLYNPLNPAEEAILAHKATEAPGSGTYEHYTGTGTYLCRRCGSPLYRSHDKFNSGCGWPSFDQELPHAVIRHQDGDGMRTEIVCATCGGHLGHVFTGEGFTPRNTRHCVNSRSLQFVSTPPYAKAYFAGGCFWGVEDLFTRLEGVVDVVSGYCGGHTENPTYQQVCSGTTGHLETVCVTYDMDKLTYHNLARWFFEIHDPTQQDGQGPDIGSQYLSALFYRSRYEYDTALALISILENTGLDIATKLLPLSRFWKAEEYHQNYYERKGSQPYCHMHTKRFPSP